MTPFVFGSVLTVDAGTKDLRAADHLLQALAAELALPEGGFGCTHLVRDDRPRVVLSFTLDTPEALRAARDRLTTWGHEVTDGAPDDCGRAVRYPGVAALTGTLPVGEILAASAIDAVTVLGTPGDPAPDLPLHTRDHVRPQWRQGRLVLAAQPAAGGILVPFEHPDPTPCCADH
ncbi:hypothetical protein ACFRI7_35520 [Streptomyces sp. NPDC056716]|uniref:hypothetical protein n=1 Tax=unclassified Streptomyces TaxID=2593676 RepID=UPI0036B40132